MIDENPKTRELNWGLHHIIDIQPQKRRFTAFTTIHENLFASSDSVNTYIWNTSGVIKTFDLAAIALFYIKDTDLIIASVRNSTHLHFIWMQGSYSVIIHPLSFSLKTITSLYFFPQTETFVTAGQGILFSKMIIPKIPGNGGSASLIEFQKIQELYHDEIFTKISTPLFIESENSIVVTLGKNLYVHSHDGSLIKELTNVTPGNITCTSYYSYGKKIVVGDELGNIIFIDYCASFTIIPINLSNSSHLLMAVLFDKYFLVTYGLDKQLTLINIKNESKLQSVPIQKDIITVRVEQSMIFLFTYMECSLYKVSIFTRFLGNTTADALKIKRSLVPNKPSKLICFQKDSMVSIFASKTGEKLLEIKSNSLNNEITDFVSGQDYYNVENEISETLLITFEKQYYYILSLRDKAESQELISIPNSTDDNLIPVPVSIKEIVKVISYFGENGEHYLLSLSSTGYIYSFSIDKKILTNSNYIGCNNIINAIYSHEYKIIIISTKDYLIIVNPITLTLKQKISKELVTTFYIYSSFIFTGDATGTIDIWELPTLNKAHCSADYNAIHSDKGKRKPLSDYSIYDHDSSHFIHNGSVSSWINDVPYAVRSLDFLKSRNLILSISNNGEIYLLTMQAFPYAHINISFDITASCFYDSNGSILVSSFNSLHVINHEYLYDNAINQINENDKNLDEFNSFPVHIQKVQQQELFNSKELNEPNNDDAEKKFTYIKNDKIKSKKHKKSYANKFIQIENTEPGSQIYNDLTDNSLTKSNEPVFENLIVEQEFIPKKHFVSPKIVLVDQETNTINLHDTQNNFSPTLPQIEYEPSKFAPRKINKKTKKKSQKKKNNRLSQKQKLSKYEKLNQKNYQFENQPNPINTSNNASIKVSPPKHKVQSASIRKNIMERRQTDSNIRKIRNSNSNDILYNKNPLVFYEKPETKPPFIVEVNKTNYNVVSHLNQVYIPQPKNISAKSNQYVIRKYERSINCEKEINNIQNLTIEKKTYSKSNNNFIKYSTSNDLSHLYNVQNPVLINQKNNCESLPNASINESSKDYLKRFAFNKKKSKVKKKKSKKRSPSLQRSKEPLETDSLRKSKPGFLKVSKIPKK